MNEIKYVIVQASGKGTRLGPYTRLKPKALVSVNGAPLLYHLENAFPKAKFYIVGDYKFEILQKFTEIYPPKFEYKLIKSSGEGSCQGLELARKEIVKDGGDRFAITWCDLFYFDQIRIPNINENYIGLTMSFPCRYQYIRNEIVEKRGKKAGIFGFFYFGDEKKLPTIPQSGEFVKFLKSNNIELQPLFIDKIYEIGTIRSLKRFKKKEIHTRFFNTINIIDNKVIKEVREKEFEKLIEDEKRWYKFVLEKNYKHIPKVYSFSPLTLEKISGWQPYSYKIEKPNISKDELIIEIINSLKELHGLGSIDYNYEEARKVYVEKTWDRIRKICNLIPHQNEEYVYVNGKKVKNLIHPKNRNLVEFLFKKLKLPSKFTVIHGDPTFSNTIIERETNKVVFIDPRGYFYDTKIYGDPLYDFAKVYYSAIGDYDQFNQHKFTISINDNKVELKIESNGMKNTEKIFKQILKDDLKNIKILHVFIWLSLAGYVIDNVDSMLGAYYKGLELLNEVETDE